MGSYAGFYNYYFKRIILCTKKMIGSLFVGKIGIHDTVWQGVVRECLQADTLVQRIFFLSSDERLKGPKLSPWEET